MHKKPKNDEKYFWTNHSVGKMVYYRISESLVKRVVRFPKRTESGVAPGTTACMQPAGSKKRPSEIWVMWRPGADIALPDIASLVPPPSVPRPAAEVAQAFGKQGQVPKGARDGLQQKFNIRSETSKKLIISTWRYPGVSKIGEPIPIPEEILNELTKD